MFKQSKVKTNKKIHNDVTATIKALKFALSHQTFFLSLTFNVPKKIQKTNILIFWLIVLSYKEQKAFLCFLQVYLSSAVLC